MIFSLIKIQVYRPIAFFLRLAKVLNIEIKPVTDEQVFYDKFLYDKFYLPSARVYIQQILYDKFYLLAYERVNKFTLTIY